MTHSAFVCEGLGAGTPSSFNNAADFDGISGVAGLLEAWKVQGLAVQVPSVVPYSSKSELSE